MEQFVGILESYWTRFLVAVPRIAMGIFVVAAGMMLSQWAVNTFRGKVLRKAHDPLMGDFLANTVKLALVIVVIMLGLHAAGLSGIAGAIMAAAGASALVLGFAFKDIGENFLAGIILAFNRPFHVNDTIQIENSIGRVVRMKFRYTHIKTYDGKDIYIPNADMLRKQVINYTEDGFIRFDFIIGVAHDGDVQRAKTIVQQCIDDNPDVVHGDPDHENFVAEDEVTAVAVRLKGYVWFETDIYRRGAIEARGRILREAKQRLVENGIRIN